MTEPRCSCCDLPWYSCGFELDRQQEQEQRAVTERALRLPGVTSARHPGRCVCGTAFGKGAPIRKHPDGWQDVTCCAEDVDL